MFQRIKKGDERGAVGGDVSSQLRPGRGKDWVDGRVFLSFLIFTGPTYFWARGSSQENQKKKAMQVGGERGEVKSMVVGERKLLRCRNYARHSLSSPPKS